MIVLIKIQITRDTTHISQILISYAKQMIFAYNVANKSEPRAAFINRSFNNKFMQRKCDWRIAISGYSRGSKYNFNNKRKFTHTHFFIASSSCDIICVYIFLMRLICLRQRYKMRKRSHFFYDPKCHYALLQCLKKKKQKANDLFVTY